MTTAIQQAATNIANAARIAVDLGGMTPDAALSLAARNEVENSHAATSRNGHWASETTSEQIDAVAFQASVAADILDGSVTRPSTGNVRAYALTLVTTEVQA